MTRLILILLAVSLQAEETLNPIKQVMCPPSVEMVQSGFPGGEVTIQFTIEPDGSVSRDNFQVVDDPGYGVADNLKNCLTKFWRFPAGLPEDYTMVYVMKLAKSVGTTTESVGPPVEKKPMDLQVDGRLYSPGDFSRRLQRPLEKKRRTIVVYYYQRDVDPSMDQSGLRQFFLDGKSKCKSGKNSDVEFLEAEISGDAVYNGMYLQLIGLPAIHAYTTRRNRGTTYQRTLARQGMAFSKAAVRGLCQGNLSVE